MKVTNYDILDPRLSRDYTMVMLSDLHNKRYKRILRKVKRLKPDYILLCGDFVDRHFKTYKRAMPFMRKIADIAPCYFSYGNHEIKFPKLTAEELTEAGITVLDNRFVRVTDFTFGGQIPIGASEEMGNPVTLDWLDDFEKANGFRILLCHHPEEYLKYVKGKDIDLTLSGHAHGGQWVLFGHGILAPGQGLFPKYTHGQFDHLIVGTGCSNPPGPLIPRIRNPKEIVKLNFLKA